MRNLLQERKAIRFQQQTIDILSKQVEKLQDKLAGKSFPKVRVLAKQFYASVKHSLQSNRTRVRRK